MHRAVIATLAAAAAFLSTMAHGQDDHGNTRETATAVAFPSETSGFIIPGTDDDYFRFTLSAQTFVVIETMNTWTEGWLYSSDGTQLAYNDDGGFVDNFRIAQTLNAGTYYVRVGGDGDALAGFYRLRLFRGDDDHGNTRQTATGIAFPGTTAGIIYPHTESDYFGFTLPVTTAVVIETTGTQDTIGWLYDSGGTQVDSNDDGGSNTNFRITQTLSAGTYYVRVESYLALAGPYTLRLSDTRDAGNWSPSFSLDQTGRAGVLSISVEALSSASDQTITVAGVTHHAAYDRAIGITAMAGINGRSGRQVFSRLDFDNMVFFRESGSPVQGILATFNHTLEAGGSNGEDYAVLSLPSTATFTAGSAVSAFAIHAAIRPDAPAAVTYTEYLRLGDAIQRRNPLHSVTRTVIFPVRSLQDEVTPGAVTATVASGFTQLTAAGANTIGTLAIDVGDDRDGYAHYAPTSYNMK